MSGSQRHGRPVALVAEARHVHRKGHALCLSEGGSRLTQSVPVQYILP